jgi:uncharacterized protein YjbI with pentapeptide repeats
MSEAKKLCEVLMHDNKLCGRDLYDEEFCIFHSKKEEKDLNQFLGELFQILGNNSTKEYDLTGFIFPKGVDFIKNFSKPTTFTNAIFKGEVGFSGAVFKEWVDFQSAQFEGETDFRGVVFEHGASFWNATFKEKTFFMLSIFKGEADFGLASFSGVVYFVDTEFGDFADFSMSTFKRLADLWNVVFKGESTFEGTSFMGTANFMGSTFEAGLLINADSQHKKAFQEEIDFTSVKFLKPELVEFQKIDLSLVRFLETDMRGVHFIDVDWNKEKGEGRNRVFDEVSPNPDNNMFDYALIAQLYRKLRANYEENLQYSEAGDFYIGEMEMRRKAETSFFKKLPIILYKAISNYGESYYRPLCWILTILLLFPIFFMIAGIQPVNHEQTTMTAEKIKDYPTSFWYSMSVFSFIREKKCTTINNWGDALFVTESILSPIMLAFLLLALRRRFKR